MLQDTLAQDRNVTCAIDARLPRVLRVKRFSEMQETAAAQGHHTHKTVELGNLAKVDLLYCSHALGKCGLFENVERTMNDKAAAKLKVGDRVRYTGEDSCPGTIIEVNWCAVKIRYDDDVICILHHGDMDEIERLDERYDVTKAA